MRGWKKILVGIILFLTGTVALLYLLDYDYIIKGIKTTYLSGHSTAYIDDYSQFHNRRIESGAPQPWPLHEKYNEFQPPPGLQKINEELETVAFLVILNDSIWYEDYFGNYDLNSKTNSFSMAKSVVAALLGRAITEGYIEGTEQPVSDFFPQFDPRLTVGDLASMASGLNWDENYYNPFSMTARAYFGDNIREQIMNLKVTEVPGEEFKYLSGNTQLLAMVIEKATGKKLAEYLSSSFWKPMGMRTDALWQLDSEESGMEKAYCCIASNARDFAKFGRLYRNYGQWNGEQLIDSSYVVKSIVPRFEDSPQYGYGFWLENFHGKHVFYMRGILGQYVIVVPEDDLVIVRLGKERGERPEGQHHPDDFYVYLEEVYKMLGEKL